MKYERLTEQGQDGKTYIRIFDGTIGSALSLPLAGNKAARVAIDRLAELEDKIESGKMIESPKIYQLSVGCKGTSLENYFIDEIAAKLTSINGMWSLEYKDRLCGNGGRKLIGYFIDKSQAEARLKELQGE